MALEACEFWSAYCEAELDNAILRPFLPQVCPLVMSVTLSVAAATLPELASNTQYLNADRCRLSHQQSTLRTLQPAACVSNVMRRLM